MDDLQEIYGVGPVTAESLHNAGYDTFEQIASATVDELAEKVGISARSAERIIQSAQEMLQGLQTQESEIESARKVLQDLQTVEPEPEQPEEEVSEKVEEISEVSAEEEQPEVTEEEMPTEIEAVEQPEEEIPSEEMPKVEDWYGIIDEIAEAVVQNTELLNKIADDIGSDLADIIMENPEIRQKIIQKALSQPNFRKMLISSVVQKLS